jgi:large subunit ribosomal protein L21
MILYCGISARKGLLNGESLPFSGETGKRRYNLMYAVIQTGGKQYRVQIGDSIYVEKIDKADGEIVTFDTMIFNNEQGETVVGTPVLPDVKVEGKVVRQTKGRKITVFKFKSKKNYRRKQGHRQPYTQVEITAINH